ncbi:MAG TPA: enoyl-CoA hydratase/isomerase family protein [Gammaproteobacteria bacterium]|nr:enoyl-CoA hydratase/isomerase family protein [Gammaproteobacteria bacterium]
MPYFDLRTEGTVNLLTMLNGENENTLTTPVLEEFLTHIETLESIPGQQALVLSSNHPKYWCLGMNLNWFVTQTAEELTHFITLLEEMLMRVAWLNMPTVACLTGHCYGAGAILACAFDFRVMRADRGRFCVSAINQKMPISGLLIDVVKLLPNAHTVHELLLTGKALGGEECLPRNVVDAIYPAEQLESAAIQLANELAEKDRHTYTTIKRGLRRQLADCPRMQPAT